MNNCFDILINRSSESITFEIESATFYEIFKNFTKKLNEKNYVKTEDLGNYRYKLYVDNIKISNPVEKIDIIDSLLDLFERTIPIETEEIFKTELIGVILRNRKEIENDMKEVRFTNERKCWDEDNDGYYPKECEDDIIRIKEVIKNEKNCSTEEITESVLENYISSKTAIIRTFFIYNSETEEEKYYRIFDLE